MAFSGSCRSSPGLSDFCSSPAMALCSFQEPASSLTGLQRNRKAHSRLLRPTGSHQKLEHLEGKGQEPFAFTFPLPSPPQTSTAMTDIMVAVALKAAVLAVVLAAVLAGARGGQPHPGAPVAPAAAGGNGCWACCSPGCYSWGCSSASLPWVRGNGGRAVDPTAHSRGSNHECPEHWGSGTLHQQYRPLITADEETETPGGSWPRSHGHLVRELRL